MFRIVGSVNYIKAEPITLEQTQQVISLFDKYNCPEISEIVGITLNQVYEVRKRNKLTNKQNPIFDISELKEQIILGGKLGDGNFKPNGKNNYYYRESHAADEYKYLKWKMDTLGEDVVAKGGIYKIKKGGYNVQQQYGFSTKTSPSFIKYAEMSIGETIKLLDYRGLIIFLLDDGWYSNHSKEGHFLISGGILNDEELKVVCEQLEKNEIHDAHVTGQIRKDISIPKINNHKLYELAISFIPKDIDIMKKKFGKIALCA